MSLAGHGRGACSHPSGAQGIREKWASRLNAWTAGHIPALNAGLLLRLPEVSVGKHLRINEAGTNDRTQDDKARLKTPTTSWKSIKRLYLKSERPRARLYSFVAWFSGTLGASPQSAARTQNRRPPKGRQTLLRTQLSTSAGVLLEPRYRRGRQLVLWCLPLRQP